MKKSLQTTLPRTAKNPSVLSSKKLEPKVENIKAVKKSKSKVKQILLTGATALALTFGSANAPFTQTAPQKNKPAVELAQNTKPDKSMELAKAQTPSASSASTQEQGNKAATYTPTVTQADVDGLPRLKVLNRVVQAEQTGFNAVEAIKKKLGENATPEAIKEELMRILTETNYDYYLVVEQSGTEQNGTYHFLSTIGVPVKNQDWDIVVDILLDQPKDGPVTGEAFISIKQKDGTEGAMEVSLTKLAEYFKYLTGTDAKAARAVPIIAGDKVAIIIYGCAFPDAPLLSGQPVVRVGVNTSDRTTLRSQNPIEIIE